MVQKLSERKAEMIEDAAPPAATVRWLVFHAPTRQPDRLPGRIVDRHLAALLTRELPVLRLRTTRATSRAVAMASSSPMIRASSRLRDVQAGGPRPDDDRAGPEGLWAVEAIVGEHTRDNDLEINVLKGKQLTNIRTTSKDEAVRPTPPIRRPGKGARLYRGRRASSK